MKETGIIRKIDKVGRVVIPKELRRKYRMECGDMVEIFMEQGTICLKKYDMGNNIMEQVEVLYETVERMEQELKDSKELEEFIKNIKNKLEEFHNEEEPA